jgi:TolB-like protein/tetratricopeptide (TPR) repeat protein/predicted Ser/Thr protein kinase
LSTQTDKVQRVCAKCGASVFADSPRGFCSVCLFRTGLGSLEEQYDGEQDPSRIQMEFGDYELLEEIGRGGQGVVYRARQKSLNRTVALKVIGLGQWSSTPHLRRFRHEAEAAASLEHPQIVPIYEIGERDGSCYFSMKFVEGGRLDEVAKPELMSARRTAELLVKIARTVQFAHEHGILHRDIKPGNILLDKNGHPHLTDFGLARLIEQESTITNSFEVLGTPSYMSPEQAEGQAKVLTPAADVYSLGAVFYHMLTGEPPFAGGTTYETIRMVLQTEPRNPRTRNAKIDVDLATICLKCLEKDSTRRYQSAAALADDVERWLRHEPIQARRTGVFRRAGKWVRRNPALAAVTPLVIGLVAVVGVMLWTNAAEVPPPSGIAVLPFENLSEDKENAYFAGGIQDDILTNLAKIGDLRVISRASVAHYKSNTSNVHEIGKSLGVATVLEGSVRRVGNHVRVNVQLINTSNGTHIWADNFDRELNDIFAIQSDLALQIASVLQTKLSPPEEARLRRRPTESGAAYLFYLQALDSLRRGHTNEDFRKAEATFEKALETDPSFALALAYLSEVESLLFLNYDSLPGRLDKARATANEALRLEPNLPEGHRALGQVYLREREYEHALAELTIAKKELPNDPEVFLNLGSIERRQGNWSQSTADFQKAVELDPKDAFLWMNLAVNYKSLRQFPEAAKAVDRGCAADPNYFAAKVLRAQIYIDWKGELKPLDELLSHTPETVDPNGIATLFRFQLKLFQRRYDEAVELLHKSALDRFIGVRASGPYPKPLLLAQLYSLLHDEKNAQAAYEQACTVLEAIVRENPNDAGQHALLGWAYAGLGRKEDAIREGKRAMELRPEAKDAFDGPLMTLGLARIYTMLGDFDLALPLLKRSLSIPGGVTPAMLRLDPAWDPLRGDPGFEKILTAPTLQESASP